ncbi:hypothetical protein DFH06DRAFT_1294988 [Mycena polygramma]|nr:hypothetical protein DFH06DRAFT_1294988 [Mycena polygramma]
MEPVLLGCRKSLSLTLNPWALGIFKLFLSSPTRSYNWPGLVGLEGKIALILGGSPGNSGRRFNLVSIPLQPDKLSLPFPRGTDPASLSLCKLHGIDRHSSVEFGTAPFRRNFGFLGHRFSLYVHSINPLRGHECFCDSSCNPPSELSLVRSFPLPPPSTLPLNDVHGSSNSLPQCLNDSTWIYAVLFRGSSLPPTHFSTHTSGISGLYVPSNNHDICVSILSPPRSYVDARSRQVQFTPQNPQYMRVFIVLLDDFEWFGAQVISRWAQDTTASNPTSAHRDIALHSTTEASVTPIYHGDISANGPSL